MKVLILNSSELDFEKYVALHRASFTEVVNNSRAQEIQNINHFKWKYNPPAGEAKIAVIEEQGRYVSANTMIPLSLSFEKQKIVGWQSCDTATDPSYRGKGLFSLCIKALAESLRPGEIFFGYPNFNSIKGFKKLGWTEKNVVPTTCRILPAFPFSVSENIKPITTFDSSLEKFLSIYSQLRGPVIERSSRYLNWRYVENPSKVYQCFKIEKNNGCEGILVLRKVHAGRFTFALIMEILALETSAKKSLLKFAAAWALKNKAWPVATLQNEVSIFEGLSAAYLPVPHQLLPKRHVLMGMVGGGQRSEIFDTEWHVQTGDWDGF